MLVELLLALAILVAYGIYKIQKKMEFWQNQGVKVPKITPILGNNPFLCMDVIMQRKNANEMVGEHYKEMHGEKFYGMYTVGMPGLMITDPETIKHVSFTNQTMFFIF